MNAPASLALLVLSIPCAPLAAQVTTERIASGLSRPLWAGAPDGDPRIFIAEKGGVIRILVNGSLLPTPFLDISTKVSGGGEQGLLGVAFHPSYASNGRFYVNYTDLAGDTVVARYTVSANRNVANPNSESVVLTADQPFDNHNGGDLHFGPDGYLYIFLGDGGSANDPACRAQRPDAILGKVLRIDVDSAAPYAIPPDNPFAGQPGVRQEIFHLGLRNPWRNAFDRLTGDLYIGDVGQDQREEIDVAPAGSAGLNFGWKVMEGTRCNSSTNCPAGTPPCNSPAFEQPITELLHSSGSCSITGGVVYRGCLCPGEFGRYFFADFCDDNIRSLEYDTQSGQVSNFANRTAELAPGGGLAIQSITSFGEDGFGELLILDGSTGGQGEVYKMVPAGAPRAISVLRNGSGVNRLCLSSGSLAIIGNVWEARVDTSGHPGATMTIFVGHTAPSSGTFFGTEEILTNRSSPRIFRIVRASTGTTDVFRVPMPCDPALVGITAYCQAWIQGGGLEGCNALDATVGFY